MNARRWGFAVLTLTLPLLAAAQPQLVWMSQYTTQSQSSYHMILTSDGNFAHCVREGYTGDVLYLVSPDGEEIWHHTYGEIGNYDAIQDVVEMPDGGFLLAGYAWVDDQGAYDARLIRTNSSGGMIWETFVGDVNETDYGRGLVRTANGRIFMTGESWTGTRSEGAVWEFTDAGELVNTSYFSQGIYSVGFYNIELTADNHLLMSGGGYFEINNYDGYAVKCDLSGNLIWQNQLHFDHWQYMTNIREASDGSIMFAGNAALDALNHPVYPWYGRLDSDGELVWQEHYPGSIGSSYLLCCTEDTDGDWLFGGRFEGGGEFHQDALMFKVDPLSGGVNWSMLAGDNADGSDEGFSEILVLGEESYMLAGDGDFGELNHPAFLAWYNATGLTIEQDSPPSTPSEFTLASVYPNPFNATTTVNISLPAPTRITVDVINIHGQVVGTVHSGFTQAGQQTMSWSADGFASGVYFVRAVADGHQAQMKKVLLVR
jgi:Secretion system C-terminal sorting domain